MSGDHWFTIRGVRVLWRYARLRGRAAGWSITPDERRPDLGRKVLIDSRLRGRTLLETEIHEGLHQIVPDLSEETVTSGARDLARILYALGYRRR
ncbi:MAG: hypothetical protein EBX36_07925 [Planctomycetia bacterium]|nr:hypothetical protein [Planctomycetia bacterium]